MFTSASARAQLRPMVYSETTVNAPLADVWADWTTAEGLESHFAPKAIIDAEPGGDYIVYMLPDGEPGSRGSDTGKVLGLQDQRMIQFTWAMPPYMPKIRPHMTVVQIMFVPVDDTTTRLRLFHTGFGEGDAWSEGRDYFAKTWPQVLTNYKTFIADDSPDTP